jgi:hypothetical protein
VCLSQDLKRERCKRCSTLGRILAARHVAESARVVGGFHYYVLTQLERDSESPPEVLVHGVVDVVRSLINYVEVVGLVRARRLLGSQPPCLDATPPSVCPSSFRGDVLHGRPNATFAQ